MSARVKFDFIPFPLCIVDESVDLSLGEYRLLGYLLRHRFRVKSEMMRITQDELLRGVFAPNGTRRDKGCGLTSGRDLKLAREKLEARGWLKVQAQREGMVFELCLQDDDEEASAERTGKAEESASAESSSGQCGKTVLPVQNALDVIRMEKVKKEQEGLTPKPPLAVLVEGEKITDPRWNDIREDLRGYWEYCNPGVPMPFDGKVDGKALKLFLNRNPTLTRPLWKRCLWNRARSEVPHAEDIHRWILTLLKFSEGAFDGYGKKIVTGGGRKHDDAQQLIDANRASGEAWLEQRRQSRAAEGVSGRVRGALEPPDSTGPS